MTSRIHLVRHAEAAHNIDKNFDQKDPPLTTRGRQQAEDLGRLFPHLDKIGLIITSPLRRAIETAEALSRALALDPGHPSYRPVNIILEPGAQEVSSLPCDTGSNRNALAELFPNLDISNLRDGWEAKSGSYSSDSSVVEQRAPRLRKSLAGLIREAGKDVVVVTHGGFMKILSGDPTINLAKAGWRSYTIQEDAASNVHLVPSDNL